MDWVRFPDASAASTSSLTRAGRAHLRITCRSIRVGVRGSTAPSVRTASSKASNVPSNVSTDSNRMLSSAMLRSSPAAINTVAPAFPAATPVKGRPGVWEARSVGRISSTPSVPGAAGITKVSLANCTFRPLAPPSGAVPIKRCASVPTDPLSVGRWPGNRGWVADNKRDAPVSPTSMRIIK